MKATVANNGERVVLTDNTRDLIDREEIFGNNGTFSEQIELQEYIQSKGVNLVHCNSCEGVFFHKNTLDVDTIVCPFCKVVTAPWDCQDYYYNGMYEHTEELNNK